jgi:hypothetical protein
VPPKLPPNWLVLSDGIGTYRAPVARFLGVERGSIDAQCRPQPDSTPQDAEATGRENLLDKLDILLAKAQHPRLILDHIAAKSHGRFLPDPDQPRDGQLLVEPAGLADGIKVILRELDRSPAKAAMPDHVLVAHVDAFCDNLRALTLDRVERRRKAAK